MIIMHKGEDIMAARVVVITGGSTGMGKAAAECFAAQGDQVMLVGRREGVLQAAAVAAGAVRLNMPPRKRASTA